MHASITEIKFKPGKSKEAIDVGRSRRPDLEQVDGLKQIIIVDRGDDTWLIVGMYESQAQQEAAGASLQETLERWGDMVEVTPTRTGGAVFSNEAY